MSATVPVHVQIYSPTAARQAGAAALALRITGPGADAGVPALQLRVPDSLLDGLYGGDYAARVHWTRASAGHPSFPAAQSRSLAQRVSIVTVPSSTRAVVLAATTGASASDGSGTFAATSLSPSSSWGTSSQFGSFSYNYPMRVPPAPSGPQPNLALSYDSGSVDGETGATNNQPSGFGDGWSLSGAGGFIERAYNSCSDDGHSTQFDLCWDSDNARLSFAGHSGTLIRVSGSIASTSTWRLQNDDGTIVTRLVGASNGDSNGETWTVTTPDGTSYYFGRASNSAWTVPVYGDDAGEPGYPGALVQAWRWNLDYVVDRNGNTETFKYTVETNRYLRHGMTSVGYTRGGTLTEIDYGANTGSTKPAAGKVTFTLTDRCSPDNPKAPAPCDSAHQSRWPDVPWDQRCLATCTASQSAPTFWTQYRVASIHTFVYSGTGTTYTAADDYGLGFTFPATGEGTKVELWLERILHVGSPGSAQIVLPYTHFVGATYANRVDPVATGDTLGKLVRLRLISVQTETGARITVSYAQTQCSSTSRPTSARGNTMRCFPQWWAPPGQPAKLDWFHKYVVTTVRADPVTGPGTDQPTYTTYNYGVPGWRYETAPGIVDSKRTWSEFAGYDKVTTRVGDTNVASREITTRTTYFRGMDGDHGSTGTTYVPGTTVPDSLWFAGRAQESTSYNGFASDYSTPVVSDTVSAPTAIATGGDGTRTAYVTGAGTSTTTTPTSSGVSRVTRTVTTIDAEGRVTQVEDQGDTATSADDRCTLTSYTGAGTDLATAYVADVKVLGRTCTTAAVPDSQLVSDTRTYYDGHTSDTTAVTRGDATRVDAYGPATGHPGTNAWQTQSTSTFDALGRLATTTDPRTGTDRTTTVAYTPAAGPVIYKDVTNTLGWTTRTAYVPQWGTERAVVDSNGRRSDATLDGLGRVTAVWQPGYSAAANPSTPSASYTYVLSQTAPSSVQSTVINAGSSATSYTLYDGLMRPIQTQSPSEGGGVIVADTFYGPTGQNTGGRPAWFTTSDPSRGFLTNTVSTQATAISYDGAGRKTADINLSSDSSGVELWRTSYYQGGDHVVTTPPAGGTVTATYTDAHGQTSKLLQYHGAAGTAADVTTYSYDHGGHLTGETDPAGNQWTWTYDLLGRQTSATDPDTGTTTTSYDNAGDVATTTDARGVTLAYSYDALDRKTGEYQDSTSGTRLASWTYDTLAKGQLTASTRYDGSDQYTIAVTGYDGGGRPTGQSVTVPASLGVLTAPYTTSDHYNRDGSLYYTHVPAVAGLPVEDLQYGYDGLGKQIGLGSTQADYLGALNFDHLNEPTDYGNGNFTGAETHIYNSYDPTTHRLIEQSVQTRHIGDNVVTDHHFTYTDSGRITSDTDTAITGNTDTQCYGYDYLQRLTSAWTPRDGNCSNAPSAAGLGGPAPYWTDYSYDVTGNRTSTTSHATDGTNTTDTYTYPAPTTGQPHAVTQTTHTGTANTGVSTGTFGYDPTGNTTRGQGRTYTWDAEGHLATITTGATTQRRIYDADGTLLATVDPVQTVLYLGDLELHKAAGSSTVTGVRTYTAAGITTAERTSDTSGNSTYSYLAPDIHGTAAAAVTADQAQNFTRRYFDPFGRDRTTTPTPWADSHGFLNQPTDPTSGTTHLGARDYTNDLGRFLSVDPILDTGDPQSLNGYAYSDNNPVNKPDPNGLTACSMLPQSDRYGCEGQGSHGTTVPAGSQISASGPSVAHLGAGTSSPSVPNPRPTPSGPADGIAQVGASVSSLFGPTGRSTYLGSARSTRDVCWPGLRARGSPSAVSPLILLPRSLSIWTRRQPSR
jgi:RHS repeat-associated protein